MSEKEIREYLLGRLAEDAREKIEARVFADSEFAAQVEFVADELMDEYASGEMTGEDRNAWESYMAARPESNEKLAFAKALTAPTGEARQQVLLLEPARRPWWSWWSGRLALGLAAALLIGGFFIWQQSGLLDTRNVLAVVLAPGTLRSQEQGQTIAIGDGIEQVRIDFQNTAGASVSIALVDGGAVVWSGTVERGVARIPASRLRSGDLVAALKNATGEEIADYSFRVTRAP